MIIIVSPTHISFQRPSLRFLEHVILRCLTMVSLALFAVTTLAADGPQTAPAEPADMQRIFNGKDLSGWEKIEE